MKISGKTGAEVESESASACIVWEKEVYPIQDPRKEVSLWFQTIHNSNVLFIVSCTHTEYGICSYVSSLLHFLTLYMVQLFMELPSHLS